MAGDFGEVRKWMEKVAHITDDAAMRRMLTKAGDAGKKSALDAASSSLGGDRKFSNWARKPALSAGYDHASSTEITVNFRPVGLWRLAEAGRHSSGAIYPRRGRGKGKGTVAGRAVRTPQGPRASSSYGASRGLKTYSEATRKASTTVPKAYHDQWVTEIRKVLA